MRIRIMKPGINGEGIGYIDRKPVFVEGALVNEEVEVKIVEKSARYAKAKVEKIVKRSEDRVRATCRYEKQCGSCTLMCANYKAQLRYKYDILVQTLEKYARIDSSLINKVKASPNSLGYRNSLKLPFIMHKDKLICALYATGTNHAVAIDHCLIHEMDLENMKDQILKVLNKYQLKAYDHKKKAGMRTLILRGFNKQFQCTLITGEDRLPASLIEELMQIEGMNSLWQSINTSKKSIEPFGKSMFHLGGNRLLDFKLNDLSLRLSPKSFFQLNTKQAENLYSYVASLIGKDNKFIIEAYSGIGAISLYLKDKAKEIVGIEYISDAVSNANRNAKLNKAEHVKFICGDAGEKMKNYSKKREIDYVVVDPPRSGLDENMMECLMRARIKHVIYISCNPATLGKNLEILTNKYKVESIQPFDMFPNTAHVESVVLLTRK